MSYHGYIPSVQQFLVDLKHPPAVLEVGVDYGTTFVPLAVALASYHDKFTLIGIDIKFDERLLIMLSLFGKTVVENTKLVKGNSLAFLPALVNKNQQFDVVLIDGDHNYHTVSKELSYLDALVNDGGFAVIDDVDGRWADRDLFYKERPGYEDNEFATERVETEKHGVKAAVDEFLENNPRWEAHKLVEGEPRLLVRKKER